MATIEPNHKIKAIQKALARRPDWTVEYAVSEVAALMRLPWKALLAEYEAYIKQEEQ